MFLGVAGAINGNKDYLASKNKGEIVGYLFLFLRSVALCSKHPGFREEKEWRIMHTQGLDNQGVLELDVETVNGIPQPVFKIPLEDQSGGGLTDISIPHLIERVIIGPTQFPLAVYDALVMELQKLGVADATSKVVYSAIPLRT